MANTQSTKDFFTERKKSKEFIEILEKKIDVILLEEHDPMLLPDIIPALELLKKHKTESITILGDFDADGITSTSILAIGLSELLNNKHIYYKVPEREDGHGLNKENIDIAIKNKSKLIITCDNASNDIEMINYAKSNGIDVIITDHHEIEAETFDFPLVNAGRKGFYPCRYLCGAGIAYKFILAVEKYFGLKINEITLEKIRMLAVIGTIADKVKMKDENLLFVLNYRKYFENPKSKIFQIIVKLLDYNPNDGKWFGWKICPVFNVAGRLGKSNSLIETIINGEKYENLEEVISYFISLNDKRKELTQAWKTFVKDNNLIVKNKYVTFIIHPDIPSGIKRLIGNEYLNNMISFCGNIRNGEIHCSVTNQLNIDLLSFLKGKNYTTNVGGHFKAFGYSIKQENLNILIDELNDFLEENKEKLFDFHEETIFIENPKDISENLINELNEFIWSTGVEEPVFESNLKVENTFLLKGEHLKITFQDKIVGMKWFFKQYSKYKLGEIVNVKYSPTINEYNKKKTLQLMIV